MVNITKIGNKVFGALPVPFNPFPGNDNISKTLLPESDHLQIRDNVLGLLEDAYELDRYVLDEAYEMVRHVPDYEGDPGKWQLSKDAYILLVKLLDRHKFQTHPFTRWMLNNTKSFGELKPGRNEGYYILDDVIFCELDPALLNELTARTLEQKVGRQYVYNMENELTQALRKRFGDEFVAEKYLTHHQNFRKYLKDNQPLWERLVSEDVDISLWDTPLSFDEILRKIKQTPLSSDSAPVTMDQVQQEIEKSNKKDNGKEIEGGESKSAQRAAGLCTIHQYEDAPTIEEYKKNYVLQGNLRQHLDFLEARHEYDADMKEEGANTAKSCQHLEFSGPPGTGKTTKARVVGRLYKDLGILESGHVVETSGSKIIAEYVGQSAPNLRELGILAEGGVLFIDEAYQIANNDKFGSDVVTELLDIMQEKKDKLIVIIAGYEDDLKRLMDMNPGLKSRFGGNEIKFDHFTPEELREILELQVKKKGEHLSIQPKAVDIIMDYMAWAKKRDENRPTHLRRYGNARDLSNLLEKVIDYHAMYLKEVKNGNRTLEEVFGEIDARTHRSTYTHHAAAKAVEDYMGKAKHLPTGFAAATPSPGM